MIGLILHPVETARSKIRQSLTAKGWIKQGTSEALLLIDDIKSGRSDDWRVAARQDLEAFASRTENPDAKSAVTRMQAAMKRWEDIHPDMRGSHRGRDRHAITTIAKLCRQVSNDGDLAADDRAIASVAAGILRVADLLEGSGTVIHDRRLSDFTASVRALEAQLPRET